MFEVGFWELVLIAVVALLVVGPERLPGLARTAGLWMGRIRRLAQSVKQDISRELAAEELQRTLNKQATIPELEEITEETNSAIQEVKQKLGPEYQQPAEKTAGEGQRSNSQNTNSHDGTR